MGILLDQVQSVGLQQKYNTETERSSIQVLTFRF